ncbi:DEAD/DEAH box helicase family protein [Bacillus cytotoxicus]|uniref:DEAD/DEAH box helicase family protein n=1 Tax=unclassified Bacillus cereus group TaxID=2750818 RepID=UPI001F58C8F5|nr:MULTISPECIES: DEAD/DEAH box helicase family protein [unclassified Bacillus cereus group]EMA6344872.1 DEAD/DEAH box helicase family protein [Bacillus cytotoxicus]
MSNTAFSEFMEIIDVYWDDPVAFAEDMLGFYPDEWQKNVLMDLAKHPKVTVRSGQGVGKTGLESVVVLWFLCCRPNPKVICTAPTKEQLFTVLWAEIAKWLERSKVKNLLKWTKTRVYMIGSEERWFATARTATKPENMQGFHEDYMLFVCDEASGIADPIMEAILGTLSGEENKLLLCGNPTRTSGVFYDSHNKDRDMYKAHKVSSMDSPRTSKDNIEMLKRKYNEDSDVYRVRVLGEFPKAEADAFIPLEYAEQAAATKLSVDRRERILHLGVDVARFGDDETVIAVRIGTVVTELKRYSKQGTTQTAGRVLEAARNYMKMYSFIKEVHIKVDADGVGGGVVDRLDEVVYEEGLDYIKVMPIHNGSSAQDISYENMSTELWAGVREILEENFSAYMRGEPSKVSIPNDEKLVSQLTTRKYRITSKGKIALEKKDDMKKRGLQSPDRADAIVLAFANVETAIESFERVF